MQPNILLKMTQIYNDKKYEYGDTDEKMIQIMQILYPNSLTKEQYKDFLFTKRIVEKLARLSSLNITESSKRDVLQDIAGYGILALSQTSL